MSSSSFRGRSPRRGFIGFGTALAVLAGGAFPVSAHAQSLLELYDAARGYDASYLAARSLYDSVAFRVEQSYGLTRPSVGLSVTSTYNYADSSFVTVTEVPVTGPQPQPTPTPQTTTAPATARYDSLTTQAAISLKYPIFNRVNSLSADQAEKLLDVAEADFDIARQDLIVRLAQAYFDVLGAQDTLNTTHANKAAITEQLASAKRNFEVGTNTITDTREAQARFDLATAQELAADNDLVTKRAALDQLVGRPNVTPKPLAAPFTLPALAPADVEAWVSTADQLQPQVRRARANLEIAGFDTRIARARRYPTLDLVGTVSNGYGKASGAGELFVPTGRQVNNSVGLQLNVPLYAGGSIEARERETLLLEERSRNDAEGVRRNIALSTRQLYYNVQSGRAQVQALEAAESSSKLAAEATELGFKVGVRVTVDVLNAQTQLYTTQRDLARARYDVLVSSLRLRQASGQLDANDVATLNRLLAP